MDGSGGARTAWVYDDWNKNSDRHRPRQSRLSRDRSRNLSPDGAALSSSRVSVGTHAIGDHAIDWVVDTYAEVLKEKPTTGLRHSIIHANIPTDHAISTMASLQKTYDAGYPESQPGFTWWIGDTYAGNFGPQRSPRLNPFHTYLSQRDYLGRRFRLLRHPIAGSLRSLGVGGARTTQGHLRQASFRHRGVSRRAHRTPLLHCLGGAAIISRKQGGSIEPGKEADIAVWDKDMYTIPSAELRNLKCEMTIYHGQIVYRAR